MNPHKSSCRTLLAVVMLLAGTAGIAHGQIPAITSNGSLGPISWTDGSQTIIFDTDAMSIDTVAAGVYTAGGGCPAGTYPGGCARLVSQPGGQDIVVYDFTTVAINQDDVYVTGSRPAAIAATGPILIQGSIWAQNGYPAGSGPGAGSNGEPGFLEADGTGRWIHVLGGGGGGGGGASAGANGFDSIADVGSGWADGGLGGVGYLRGHGPLQGGSGGGAGKGTPECWDPADYRGTVLGGKGGGALIISTPDGLTVSGSISAAGFWGEDGDSYSCAGGGGGGGGGLLVLEVGGHLGIEATGVISASGGAGGSLDNLWESHGGGGGRGGGGLIVVKAATMINAGLIDVGGGTRGMVVYSLPGQVPGIVSNGGLGPATWADGSQTIILNTDAMTIDIVPSGGVQNTGGGCPAGTYTGPDDPDGCARLVRQPGGQDIVVYDFTTVAINQDDVYVTGSRPAAIAATGPVAIQGVIKAQNGYAAASGPAAGSIGVPAYYGTDYGSGIEAGGGGGGGGGATDGGGGSGGPWEWTWGGAGGSGYLLWQGPLQGGSGGGPGGGADSDLPGAAGGSGGGALIIATPDSLTVSGTISAEGSPGEHSNAITDGGGGGGGGGFLILQVGGHLAVEATGRLTVSGGEGGNGPDGYHPYFSAGGDGGGGVLVVDAMTMTNAGTIETGQYSGAVGVFPLTVTGSGSGAGTVGSQVALIPAIRCAISAGVTSGICHNSYASSSESTTTVTLTALPSAGSSFAGWGGACTGTGACTMPMTEVRNVTAAFVAAPTLTAVNPASGPTLGGTAVTITGTSFASGATVTVGGVAATGVVVSSTTSITAVTPAHEAGVVDVVVTNPDTQTCILAHAFTYVAPVPPAPTISGVAPQSGPVAGGTAVTITGTDFVAGQTTVTVGGSAATSVVVTSASELTAVTPAGTAGGATVAVTTSGGAATLPNGFTYLGGVYRRYFAEGAIVPGFFEVDLALLNPDPAMDAHVWLRFQREGATEVGHGVVVPALGRRTVRLNDLPVMGTASYTAFSTVIESDVPVVADRTMVWDDRGYGAHAETSVASPALTWYLAEGATHSGFDLYYLIQNPDTTAVTVQVTYLRPAPLAPVVKQYAVGPSSRKTIYVNGEGPELAATDVSATIESLDPSVPIIVERAMYLADGWGHQFGAGHESAGVTAPSTHWFLAEGATVSAFGSTASFFDMYVLIANPNEAAATVTMAYLLPDGTTVEKTLEVAGNSRQTVYVNGADERLADTPVSAVVISTQPVIVERAMWWPGPTWATWYEAHNSPGTTETGTVWALAEGESGGSRGTETYILVANTSAYAGQVKVTLLFEEGTPATSEATFTLLANSRRTIYPPLDFAGAVPAGAHRRHGVLIESVGETPAQIVVERAMYSNDAAGVVWAAGTNAVATKLK